MKISKFIFLGLISILFLESCFPFGQLPNAYPTIMPTLASRTPSGFVGVETVWSLENMFILYNWFDITLDSFDDRACFLGSVEKDDFKKFVCIESQTGKIIWSKESGIHRTLAVTPNGIFITYSSPAEIKKYDKKTGTLVWNKKLGGTGTLYLYYFDNQIQVSTTSGTLWILDQNAEVIRKVKEDRAFFSTNEATYIDLIGLQVLKTESKEKIWEYLDLNHLSLAPIFTQDKIFLRDGDNFSGTVYAFNRKNGVLLWKRENVIGNIEYSSAKELIYALDKGGNLIAINTGTGEEYVAVNFSSMPFIFYNGENALAYQLAYNETENLLFVYLGDSRQLFSFREVK